MSEEPPEVPVYKIAVIGDTGVGKSALILQFMEARFVEEYKPTTESTALNKQVAIGADANVHVLDTSGKDVSEDAYMYAPDCDAYLVVLDTTRSSSAEASEQHLGSALRARGEESNKTVPPVIVFAGNKTDMQDERELSYDVARALADKYNAEYMELSAKDFMSSNGLFHSIVEEMRAKLPQYQPAPQATATAPCSVM